jgi:hypothetical protein
MAAIDSHHSPDDLLALLHRANEQLHQARLDWEHSLEASEFRHQERVDAAWQKLLELEHEVEDLTKQIHTSFSQSD